MKTSRQQLLRNPDVEPSSDVIAEALGEGNSAYVRFISELPKYDIQLEWRYYSDGKAWLGKGRYRWTGLRGGKNETTVFWLSIWDGFFRVTIFVPEKARADALDLFLDHEVKKMIEESKPMGKLKVFPVVFDFFSDDEFEGFFSLAAFRKSLK